MKVVQKLFNVSHDKYYLLHLTIVNAVLPIKLTDKELEVLSSFMALDKSITEDFYFNPVARKRIINKLGLSTAGLSNHIKSMIDKGFLIKNNITGNITIKEFLLPENDGQGYNFKINKI